MNDINGWFITDDDCLQCCRMEPESNYKVFELAQINRLHSNVNDTLLFQVAHGHLYLEDYTAEEQLNILSFYGYGDWNGFREAYPTVSEGTLNQYLAEMFFETELQEFVCRTYATWNRAVEDIQSFTGLDLSSYLDAKDSEKKKSLDETILAAQSNLTASGRESPKPDQVR